LSHQPLVLDIFHVRNPNNLTILTFSSLTSIID